MTNLDRQLIQIVEIDIERCALSYGNAPCAAVLGTTGVRKCYNTFKTCQNRPNFNAPVQPATASRTYSSGDSMLSADFSRSASFFLAVDLTIPAAPFGVIWELGATGTGAYLGFTDGRIVWRCGNGATATSPSTAKISANPSAILGETGTLYGGIDFDRRTVQLWWQPTSGSAIRLGINTAPNEFLTNTWAGTNPGGVGFVNSVTTAGEDTRNFNGTITEARVYDNTLVSPHIETLRFAQNVDGLPRNQRIYPALASRVRTNPSRINLGGVSDRSGPLGKRARVQVNLQDFADSDIWFDRYQSERVSGVAQTDEGGYNPQDRGTFFAKFRQRFPYYVGRNLRVLEGEVGQSLSSMRTRHYVISEWSGPDAGGSVQITAKDALDLAENRKAQAPRPSLGKLGAGISDSAAVSFNLTPASVGDDYPASGRASIGSEVVSYTRSGDTITLTGRGLDGSEATTHNLGDVFQEAYHVSDGDIATVAQDLLVNYANVPSGYIDTATWQSESTRWLAGFNLNATITKPTGVTQLLGELAQMGVIWWWDDAAQQIIMRANRPLDIGETDPDLSDKATFIEKTIDAKDLYEERLSRVLYWHGQIDASGSATDGNNFRRVSIPIDASAEGPNEYNQTQLVEIFNRWLGSGSDSVADAVAARLLNRYRDTPQEFTFQFDAKDAPDIVPATPVTVTSRLLVDDTGNALKTQMQVTSVEEIIPNHRLQATAQSYQFDRRYGFITENTRPDYSASTDAQREQGTYIVDGSTLAFPDGSGPYVMF